METISPGLWSAIYLFINVLLCIGGFVLTFMIKRLYKTIDELTAADDQLRSIVQLHREDVLRNYPMTVQLHQVKAELFMRIDRLEDNLLKKPTI